MLYDDAVIDKLFTQTGILMLPLNPAGARPLMTDKAHTLFDAPIVEAWLKDGLSTIQIGSGAFDGDRSKAVTIFNTHGITPETDRTCHHFWVSARDFALDDPGIHKTMAGIREVFLEDVAMVEAQQRIRNYTPDAYQIDINADVPTIQARKLVKRLIAAQA